MAGNLSKYSADLIGVLKNQIGTRPGLALSFACQGSRLCAGLRRHGVLDRLSLIRGKTGTSPVTPLSPSQAILFHPIGFPGRFSRVETNVVIVDDCWAVVGGANATAFRLR
jgi:hypothetical protein